MATLAQTGIPGVGSGIMMPKHKNRWRLTFSSIGAGGTGSSSDLSMQVINTNRPTLTFDEIQLDRYNSRAWIGGKHTWEPLNITVEDDINGRASIVIQDQLERQQKLIGADGPWLNAASTANDYKFASKLEMLDGYEGVTEVWVMEGCWLQNATYGDLDYAASEVITISLAIRFDHARQELPPTNYNTALGGFI